MFWGAGLTLKTRGPGRLVLSPSLSFRLLFAGVFVVVLAALLSEPAHQRPAGAPVIFAVLLAAALLYNDSWVFDLRRGTAEGRFGLLVLFRCKRIELASLVSFRVRPAGRMARLEALASDGKIVLLDASRAARAGSLGKNGRRIAEFCSLPFEEQTRRSG